MSALGPYVPNMLVLGPEPCSFVQGRRIPHREGGTLSSSSNTIEDAAWY